MNNCQHKPKNLHWKGEYNHELYCNNCNEVIMRDPDKQMQGLQDKEPSEIDCDELKKSAIKLKKQTHKSKCCDAKIQWDWIIETWYCRECSNNCEIYGKRKNNS